MNYHSFSTKIYYCISPFSSVHGARASSGKNSPKANDGRKAKEEKLRGSPLRLCLDSNLTKVVEYDDNEGAVKHAQSS